jgi:hypothetical protein
MRTMLAVSVVGFGLVAARCGAREEAAMTAKCEVMVLEDTVEAYASAGTVYATTTKDTVPRPRASCLTLYANAGDTVPKPK